MRILLYGINFEPELTGIGKYTGEMARWLAAAGHDVRVVTAPPYYPEWAVRAPYSAGRYMREDWQGVTVFRTPLWVPKRVSGVKRLVHLASFALSSVPVLFAQWRWKPEVVWVTEPPLFCTPAALCFSRMVGAASWLHVQDYEVDAAFALGVIKGERVRRWVNAVERWLMQRFDRVSTISQRMLERAAQKGVKASRLVSLPNWADIDAIQPLTRASRYRELLGIDAQAVVALYSGNMGGKQGLEILGECAAALGEDGGIHFVFCGSGPAREALMTRCAGMSHVSFLDLQPLDQLGELLGLADIHLLPQRADAADLVMPSKLTGMLGSGRPVIATAHAGTELATVVAQCGLVVEPENPPALVAALRALASSPDSRQRMGRAARAYAQEHLDQSAVLKRFESALAQAATEQAR
ncbi:glycosyltransferase WbuB [Xenophilus aerolatus]|nr:glycosyltransferase WbuB [Xenophilus aerolatus]